MPTEQSQVRPIAICVFRRGDHLFVAEGYDPAKKQVFYRPLGGTIEFGEYSQETIAREIREELGEEITSLRYLATFENIFTHNREPGHEIVQVYEAAFANPSIYDKAWVNAREGDFTFKAMWKPIADFQNGQTPLYPEGLLELLLSRGGSAG